MIQCWLHFFSYCKDNTDTVSFTIRIDMWSNFCHFTYAGAEARLGESTCSRHRCRTCGRVRRTSLEWVILHTYLLGGNLSRIVTPSHQALPMTWKPWQFSMIIERFAKSWGLKVYPIHTQQQQAHSWISSADWIPTNTSSPSQAMEGSCIN